MLSVIIPIYNADRYLEKCLDSILNQTYKDIEIILINDGSNDDSLKLAKKYEKINKNIILINQKNHGQAFSRNVGLEKATGDYITFVDSDDFIDKDMYKKMLSNMKSEKSSMCICDILAKYPKKEEVINCTHFDYLYNSSGSVCNKIFKKELIKDLRFIENIWYEDYNFFMNVCLKNPKYSLVHEPLYIYLIHDNSTMRNNNTSKNLDIITATEDIVKKTNDKDLVETIVVNHILVDAINRVYLQKSSKDRNKVIKELNSYIHKNIKNIFKTKEYKSSSIKRKIIILLNYYCMGKVSNILLKCKGGI